MLSEYDKYLYEGCVNGDEKIMGLFYKKFSPIVFAQLRRYLPNHADVEDVLQDTFIKIFLKIIQVIIYGLLIIINGLL